MFRIQKSAKQHSGNQPFRVRAEDRSQLSSPLGQKIEIGSKDKKHKFLYVLFFVLCFLFSVLDVCQAEEESSGDEITGGSRFASPGAGDQYRWKVEGDKARFISKDVIEISPVRAIVWSEKESEYLIKTDWARLNKTTKDIWTDSHVEIIKGNSKMTGVGLKWYTAKKKVRILKDVKMTLDLGEAKQWQFK